MISYQDNYILKPDKLKDQWVTFNNISNATFDNLAKKWKPAKNKDARDSLPEDRWQEIYFKFADRKYIYPEAVIESTVYTQYGRSFLIWLTFLGADDVNYTFDVYLSDYYCTKHIDPRSPKAADLYNAIKETKAISPDIAVLLKDIGSKTWKDSTELKVQKKINSCAQQAVFEHACEVVGIKAIKLDEFDDYCYKGDPGKLADYDLVFPDGSKVRIDVKLVKDLAELCDQKKHDAELLIGSNWQNAETASYRVFGEESIENTELFKELLKVFSETLKDLGKIFIHISEINTITGHIDCNNFGNYVWYE